MGDPYFFYTLSIASSASAADANATSILFCARKRRILKPKYNDVRQLNLGSALLLNRIRCILSITRNILRDHRGCSKGPHDITV